MSQLHWIVIFGAVLLCNRSPKSVANGMMGVVRRRGRAGLCWSAGRHACPKNHTGTRPSLQLGVGSPHDGSVARHVQEEALCPP